MPNDGYANHVISIQQWPSRPAMRKKKKKATLSGTLADATEDPT